MCMYYEHVRTSLNVSGRLPIRRKIHLRTLRAHHPNVAYVARMNKDIRKKAVALVDLLDDAGYKVLQARLDDTSKVWGCAPV